LKLKGVPFMYADDLAIVYENKTCEKLEKMIEQDMRIIKKWMEEHKLNVNSSKTKYIIFKRKPEDYIEIKYGEHEIQLVRNYKYLGVILDEKLNWAEQIQRQVKKARKIAGVFKLVGRRIPKPLKKSLYFSMFHSVITYNIQIWGNTYGSLMKSLQTVQNKAIKNLFCYESRTATSFIHCENGILPLNYHIKFKLINQVHMMLTNKINTNTQLQINSNIHNYNTRTAQNIRIMSSNIRFNNCETVYNAAYKLYNDIPQSIKNLHSIHQFKNKIKELFFNELSALGH